MTRAKVKVWSIDWNSYLVRGIDNVAMARELVRSELRASDMGYVDEEIDEWFCRHSPEVGWFRCNPCICGEGHAFDMAKVDGPGPGNFRAVYFS
jgi:hypothetical protein